LSAVALGEGTVVRNNGSEVVISQGIQNGVNPGARFVVVRDGQPVGELEVKLVDQDEAITTLVSGEARPGDQVRGTLPNTGTGGPPVALPSAGYSEEQLRQYENRYKELYSQRSATNNFEAASQNAGTDATTDAMMWMNVGTLALTSFGPYGFMGSPLVIASTAGDLIGQQVWMGNYYQNAEVEITVTSWDAPLVEAYADYTAYRESRGNPGQMAALKQIVVSQKGGDQSQAFEVRIRNVGPVMVQLAPFNFHMFLLVEDRKLQCDRFDQTLDKALNPGEETVGQVFFPRLPQGNGARVALTDILGNDEDFTLGR
jgi:hypothetical protein